MNINDHRLSLKMAALADPTRRAIINRLQLGEATVMDLAAPFAMSQPAISKHLKTLEEAGLILRGRDAQKRPCRLAPDGLSEIARWMNTHREMWEHTLDRLETYLETVKEHRVMTGNATTILPIDKPQIITTRVLNAPRELVWKVLSSPDHLKHFWGPDGFTNTFKTFDFREGGKSRFTMHGPDGTDYPNRIIYRELDAPRYIRWDHDNGGEGDWDHKFVGEIELYEEGDKTRIELRVNEPSMEVA